MTWPMALRFDARQWGVGLAVAAGYLLIVALSTDLVDNPVFGRAVPPTWWALPSLVLTALLVVPLTATYVRPRGSRAEPTDETTPPGSRTGMVGATLTWFAVGCPVCNKLVLLVLGWNGALTWFAPFQPVLQVLAVALLVWALAVRLRGRVSCPVPQVGSTAR
ncbi:hypothetical protein ACQP1U_05945 [Actinomycetota bacterium]